MFTDLVNSLSGFQLSVVELFQRGSCKLSTKFLFLFFYQTVKLSSKTRDYCLAVPGKFLVAFTKSMTIS